jgi:hypothetical protein
MDPRIPPLASATRALLSQERTPTPADPALRRRVLERARAALEDRPSGVALRAGDPKRVGTARSRFSRSVLLVAAVVATVGLAAAGAKFYGVEDDATTLSPPPVAAVAPAPAAQRAQPKAATPPAPEPAEVGVDAPRPPRASEQPSEPARAANASRYALELQLLEPARRSIARGDFSGALAAIARHQHEYPRGQLVEEREALRVRALWGMGARPAAESAAAQFRKRYPHSGLLSWMKTAAKSP